MDRLKLFLIFLAIAPPVLLVFALSTLMRPDSKGLEPEQFIDDNSRPEMAARSIEKPRHERPNIVVILADDLGYGDVGAYGGRVIQTPHIDELARQGMRFTNAYSSAPICSPSRTGLLTGRYPARSGIVQAIQAAGDSLARRASFKAGIAMSSLGSIDMRGGYNMVNGLPSAELTIAEMLKQAGYRTAMFGKWHLGDFTAWPEFHPHRHGFDHFVGFNMSNDDWPVAFYRNEKQLIDDIGLEQSHYTKLFTDEAVAFIEEASEQPFFVFLSQKDPHQPFIPSEKFAGTSDGGPYGDAVSEFDWSVGEVVAALRRNGHAANTLLIVTSDNGPWYEGSAGGLRGRKGQSYEGGFRVPMVAWWPGTIAAESVSDTAVMNIDFLPTIANLTGIELEIDRVIDGVDISPVLKDRATLPERALYFFHDYDVEAVRVGDWKFIASNSHYVWPNPLDKQDTIAGRAVSARDYSPPGSDVSVPTLGEWPLLYHLGRDPEESYNLAKKHPRRVSEMEENLNQWKSGFYENPRGFH